MNSIAVQLIGHYAGSCKRPTPQQVADFINVDLRQRSILALCLIKRFANIGIEACYGYLEKYPAASEECGRICFFIGKLSGVAADATFRIKEKERDQQARINPYKASSETIPTYYY